MKYPTTIHPKTGVIHYGRLAVPRTLCGLSLCTPFKREQQRAMKRIPKAERRYCKACVRNSGGTNG